MLLAIGLTLEVLVIQGRDGGLDSDRGGSVTRADMNNRMESGVATSVHHADDKDCYRPLAC